MDTTKTTRREGCSDVPAELAEGRVPWVDYAKGICIVLVVMMHTTQQVEGLAGREGFMRPFVAFAQPFRMPDFFLLAGLFLSRVVHRDLRTFVDRKVIHFAYFYLLWATILFATKIPAWTLRGDWASFGKIPMALIQPVGTLWFIYLLPIFFITVKLLHDVNVDMKLVWLAAAALETLRVATGWVVIDQFCARAVYFLTGYLLAPHVFAIADWMTRRPRRAVGALAAWVLVNEFCVFGPAPFPGYTKIAVLPGVSLVLGFAGALAVVSIAALLDRSGALPFIRYCGQNSIVIYLAFFLALAPLKYAVLIFDIPIGWVSLAITAICIAVPLGINCVVRGTRLGFLFVRPERFRLGKTAGAPARRRLSIEVVADSASSDSRPSRSCSTGTM